MKTLFIGGTRRGYLTLEALLEGGADLAGIISLAQDDHEADRYEGPIRDLAGRFRVPLYETKFLKDKGLEEIISRVLKPDIAFVVGSRIMIPRSLYTIPPLGTLAVHDSMLPHYRGFAPLNWSVINGEESTGVTLFYLSDLMDGGDIVAQKAVAIGEDDTAPEVYDRVCAATIDVIMESYPTLENGTAPRIAQDYGEGSFTCSRIPADGLIDWTCTTKAICDKVRGLTYPYPGAFTFYKGTRLRIWKAAPAPEQRRFKGRIPGRVIGFSKEEGFVDVLSGDGTVRILSVGFDGEEPERPSNVITSVRASLGVDLVEVMERLKRLEAISGNTGDI